MASKKRKDQAEKKSLFERFNAVSKWVYLPVLFFTFISFYNQSFDKKVDLNGDNVSYYILSQAIADGEGFTNIHQPQQTAHNHYPPGYPFILATASTLFTDNIDFLKKVNGFFLILSIGLIFFIVLEITENTHLAFVVSLFCILNYHLLRYSVIMMSEVPFLFFSTLVLWLLLKTDFEKAIKTNYTFLGLVLVLAATYYIRSTGLALFGGIALFLLIKKHWSYLIGLVGGFIALILPWFIRSQSLGGSSYAKQLVRKNPYRPELGTMELSDWFTRFWENLQRYITREIPSGLFNYISTPQYKEEITTEEWVIGLLILAVILFGLFRLKRFFYILLFYFGASFAILLLWPDVWYGIRFVLPLIPFLLFLFTYGLQQLFVLIAQLAKNQKFQTAAFYLPLFLVVFVPSYTEPLEKLELIGKANYTKAYNNYFNLAKWIRINTESDAVTSCRKGQLFYLYSKKPTVGYLNTLNAEELVEDLAEKGVDYVVIDQLGYSSTGRYLVPAAQKYTAKFQVIQHLKDPDTYLCKFNPDIGYSGEFKDNKRHGVGSFIFGNGQVYEGEWKEGLRDGRGELRMPDGSRYAGTWKNDKMDGVMEIYSPNNQLIEKALFQQNNKVTTLPQGN